MFGACARPSVSSSDLLKSWGGSVVVACGARLSCSVVMVYSVLLSVSLVAHAPIWALRLWCAYDWRETCIYKEWCAIARGSQYNVNERSESIFLWLYSRTFLYVFIYLNKWPTRGFRNIVSYCVLWSSLPTTLVMTNRFICPHTPLLKTFQFCKETYHYITERSVRWYYALASLSICRPPLHLPVDPDEVNTLDSKTIQPISFQFYMWVETYLIALKFDTVVKYLKLHTKLSMTRLTPKLHSWWHQGTYDILDCIPQIF